MPVEAEAPAAPQAANSANHQITASHSMRQRLESTLLAIWYPQDLSRGFLSRLLTSLLLIFLLPLSLLYGSFAKRKLAKRRQPGFSNTARPDALIVVVGNISVGGTGKTPLLLKLAESLHARGHRFAVLSRGYGGTHVTQSNTPRWISAGDLATEVGDEPLLLATELAKLTGDASPMVMIGAKRSLAMQAVLSECTANAKPIDVILSDDGLQHYALPRDVEYAVVDNARRFGNRRLLPAGPLREPVARLGLCDAIVVNGADTEHGFELAGFLAIGMQVNIVALRKLAAAPGDDAARYDASEVQQALAGKSLVIAVAALGNPSRFFDGVQQLLLRHAPDTRLVLAAFADHHAYSANDFEKLAHVHSPGGDALFLVTGKDAVKCLPFAARMPLDCLVGEVDVQVHDTMLQPMLEGLQQLEKWRAEYKV
ncbi:MAG: tetraacyldisaccharide 4'-kinase [Pseudomonadales bacterium]|nr:tetraacyldisaccharide 4'-kinase [Pseudomonadales bacterium]